MEAFVCGKCGMYCCSCNGCGSRIAADGTRGCSRCITNIVKPISPTVPIQPYYNQNRFTNIHGKPQITYKGD